MKVGMIPRIERWQRRSGARRGRWRSWWWWSSDYQSWCGEHVVVETIWWWLETHDSCQTGETGETGCMQCEQWASTECHQACNTITPTLTLMKISAERFGDYYYLPDMFLSPPSWTPPPVWSCDPGGCCCWSVWRGCSRGQCWGVSWHMWTYQCQEMWHCY